MSEPNPNYITPKQCEVVGHSWTIGQPIKELVFYRGIVRESLNGIPEGYPNEDGWFPDGDEDEED